MDANTRKQIDAFLTKAYTTFHGSPMGLDQLKMTAKATPFRRADSRSRAPWISPRKKEAERQAAAAANPMLALWTDIRDNLKGDNSDMYWMSVKGAGVPAA